MKHHSENLPYISMNDEKHHMEHSFTLILEIKNMRIFILITIYEIKCVTICVVKFLYPIAFLSLVSQI